MEISTRNILIGTTVIFFTGATVSYYVTRNNIPEKVVIKTEVVEKIVIKEIENKKVATKTKTDKTTTTTTKPDGTIVVVKEDKSKTETNTEQTKVSEKSSDKVAKSSSVASAVKDWRAGVKTDLGTTTYEFNAGRRVLWGIWAEASYNTQVKKPLLGLSMEF